MAQVQILEAVENTASSSHNELPMSKEHSIHENERDELAKRYGRYPCRFRESMGCEKTFTTSVHESRHSKIHTAETGFFCSWPGCQKKFTLAKNMKRHLATHTKDRSRSSAPAQISTLKGYHVSKAFYDDLAHKRGKTPDYPEARGEELQTNALVKEPEPGREDQEHYSDTEKSDPELAKSDCRYKLLHPEVKGFRCACMEFSLNGSIPGSTCDCGHLAYYHSSTVSSSVGPPEVGTLLYGNHQMEDLERKRQSVRGKLRQTGGLENSSDSSAVQPSTSTMEQQSIHSPMSSPQSQHSSKPSEYHWNDHISKMRSLYLGGMSVPEICKAIQDETTGFTPSMRMVYQKFQFEGYPTDKKLRAEFMRAHELSTQLDFGARPSTSEFSPNEALHSDATSFLPAQNAKEVVGSSSLFSEDIQSFEAPIFHSGTYAQFSTSEPINWNEVSMDVRSLSPSEYLERQSWETHSLAECGTKEVAKPNIPEEGESSDSVQTIPIQSNDIERDVSEALADGDRNAEAFRIGYTTDITCEDDEISNTSIVSAASSLPSVVDSIFTMPSGSSMSSVAGPQGAGERLVALLLEDAELRPLLSVGLRVIEEERFERNFRRLLKVFANGLMRESKTDQQRHTAKFVRVRARNSAHMICRNVSEFNGRPDTRARQLGINLSTEDLTGAEGEDRVSEDDESNPSGDELDDLQHLEVFIKSSQAFDALRKKLEAFVQTPEKQVDSAGVDANLKQGDKKSRNNDKDTKSQAATGEELPMIEKDNFGDTVYRNIISTLRLPHGLLDGMRIRLRRQRPQVPPGKTRVEWQCTCRKTIYDDFIELVPGAAERMKRTLTSFDSGSRNISRVHSFSSTFSAGIKSITSFFTLSSRSTENSLPVHEQHVPLSEGNPTPHDPNASKPEPQFLPICYNEGRYATRLMQPDLVTQNIDSDRALFKLLRKSYKATKGKLSSCSLQTLSSIRFVHFELYCSALVDVRKVDDIPPPEHVEYRYAPVPPELIPPIGHNHMMHLFHNPSCALNSPVLMQRFPKKILRPLTCPNVNPLIPGWGIQFLTTYSVPKLFLLFSIFFCLGSAIFGVLWCVFKHSIQDAFAIAAYVVALGGVGIGSVQALLVI